jgi:hypothetical protein
MDKGQQVGDQGRRLVPLLRSPTPLPRPLRVHRLWSMVLEQFLQPLAAALGHDARVPPAAGTEGLNDGDGPGGLGNGLSARPALFAPVTDWFLALHGLALPSCRDHMTSYSRSIAENDAWARRQGHVGDNIFCQIDPACCSVHGERHRGRALYL